MSKLTNCCKGMACGVLTWILIFGFFRFFQTFQILTPIRDPLKILALVIGPALYPLFIRVVFRYQLPPLSPEYIRKNWPLWIPGLLLACLPSLDILILNKRLINLILG